MRRATSCWRRLQAARTELQPRAQALRDADDWQRWANATVQERLIGEMEALVTEADAAAAFKRMRDLTAEWKTVAAAPRDRAEAFWNRFRAAADVIRARFEPIRAQQSAEQADHLARKIALCEKGRSAGDVHRLDPYRRRAEGASGRMEDHRPGAPSRRTGRVGTVPDRVQQLLHQASGRSEAAQGPVVGEPDEEGSADCARRGARRDAGRDAAFAELKTLQADWRTIGPVKKSKSEQVWQRFRAAADAVFDRYRNRDAQALADRVGRRESIVGELEGLSADGDALKGRDGLLEKVRSLRTGWQQAGAVPREAARALTDRYERALGAIAANAPDTFRHTELDITANRKQLEALCERVERLAGKDTPTANAESPAELLAHQLREALAANTIGGRVDDETRWKTSEYEVRAAQDAWRQVGFVPKRRPHRSPHASSAHASGSTGSDAPPLPGRVTLTLAVHGAAVRRARAGRARPDGNRSRTNLGNQRNLGNPGNRSFPGCPGYPGCRVSRGWSRCIRLAGLLKV